MQKFIFIFLGKQFLLLFKEFVFCSLFVFGQSLLLGLQHLNLYQAAVGLLLQPGHSDPFLRAFPALLLFLFGSSKLSLSRKEFLVLFEETFISLLPDACSAVGKPVISVCESSAPDLVRDVAFRTLVGLLHGELGSGKHTNSTNEEGQLHFCTDQVLNYNYNVV